MSVKLYLSSSFSATDLGGGDLLPLRLDMKQRALRFGVEVKLGELDPAVRAAVADNNDLGVLEGCARLMGECDAFFGMLFQRHGSPILLQREPAEVRAAVSFFEAELLEACITSKPAYVVHDRAMPPAPSMQAFLRLVRDSLGGYIDEIERSEFMERFDMFCAALAKRAAPRTPWLLDSLSIVRLRRTLGLEAKEPKLAFLGGLLREDGDEAADQSVLRASLMRAESGVAETGAPLGQLARLSYLWIGVRELAKAPAAVRIHDLGAETDRLLGLWNSSAAWYGLHGAHPMGCLAALNDLGFTRMQTGNGDEPIGPRASAYYSIGGRMRAPMVARRFYKQCLRLATTLLQSAPDNPSNALQLTASAQAQLARRLEPWRYPLALADFKASLDWRTRHGATAIAVGEAKAAYGHALFEIWWRRREALSLVAEGVDIIKREPSGEHSGFYFRAARRHAEMLSRAGKRDQACAVAVEARDHALAAQAFDQSRQLQDVIDRIEP
jgi:hypothetical protein